jgi:3-deoxy-7-phosphoheptulonate synthase
MEALQMATWEDKAQATAVLTKLGKLPPLVQPSEADRLKSLLAAAGRGEKFIIQGGDCAERFMDCEAGRLETQIKLILQMGMITEQVSSKPAVCIARIAGQYGKPRSKPTETVDGKEVMSFKGDNINGFELADRKWDPDRLLQGYWHSAATLNYLRSLASSPDSKAMSSINVGLLQASPQFKELEAKASAIGQKFSAGGAPMEFFTSHEAMQLDLEEALTRKVGDKYYNLSAHLVWIGDRTRQLSGAHVEYFRGITNPIGVKVGPSMKGPELKDLVAKLNPSKEEGRIMLITRYGAGKVKDMLPTHIKAVQESGVPVVWQCDGVHGNGIVASNKYKTRKVEDVLQEIRECFAIHKECGSVLGGVHLEVTGQETVTECLGGCVNVTENDLTKNYETYCDPRLNYAQAIEAAFKVAEDIPEGQGPAKKQKA